MKNTFMKMVGGSILALILLNGFTATLFLSFGLFSEWFFSDQYSAALFHYLCSLVIVFAPMLNLILTLIVIFMPLKKKREEVSMSNEYETAFYRSVVEPISDDIYIVYYFKRPNTSEPFAPDKDDVRHIGGLKAFENKKNAHKSAFNYSRRRG